MYMYMCIYTIIYTHHILPTAFTPEKWIPGTEGRWELPIPRPGHVWCLNDNENDVDLYIHILYTYVDRYMYIYIIICNPYICIYIYICYIATTIL